MPGGYMPWYKITEVSEPIFKTFSLSKGESIKITAAGKELAQSDYTYDKETGNVVIPADKIFQKVVYMKYIFRIMVRELEVMLN